MNTVTCVECFAEVKPENSISHISWHERMSNDIAGYDSSYD